MTKLTLRVWILIFFLLLGILMIKPTFQSGALIKSVEQDSSASKAGLAIGEIIKSINGQPIRSSIDYINFTNISIQEADFIITTDAGIVSYQAKELGFDVDNLSITNINEFAKGKGIKENSLIISLNNYSIKNEVDFYNAKAALEPKIKFNVVTNKQEYVIFVNKPLEITVANVPRTRIKTGLDLQGGARALVKPEKKLNQQEMNDLIAVSRYRLNVYGLTDVNVRSASDMLGNRYMLVEIAGATPSELRDLIAKQGKFEAKIGNETVFIGGKKDITSVCRNDATCSGIQTCFAIEGGEACKFTFVVYLSEDAAKRHADITAKLSTNVTTEGNYLSKKLDLYLDDKLVDSLLISEDLKGKVTTQVQVQGSGTGKDRAEAYNNAEASMQKLQTVLITGSLPFKLEIVKLDNISPLLGKEFIRNLLLAALVSFIIVALIIAIRYKKISLTLLIMLTMFSEVFLVLAFAALIGWNIDLASIAGIIAVIGTGVDDQIVIVDEGGIGKAYSWKERLKKAFAIIIGAYLATTAAMLPLIWAGAGLLKGFAITTIIGISIGVLLTRPAFADLVSKIEQ
ncbi:hypothetical protein HZA33_01465 [Candidatus Pacearchaeota archaeon]|nr:hypothetical protein [Candidatus Pacearchaeota archaeon]